MNDKQKAARLRDIAFHLQMISEAHRNLIDTQTANGMIADLRAIANEFEPEPEQNLLTVYEDHLQRLLELRQSYDDATAGFLDGEISVIEQKIVSMRGH